MVESTEQANGGVVVEEAVNEQPEIHEGGRFKDADPDGGFYLHDEEGVIAKTIKDMMKTMGKNLITGQLKSLISMRTPAYIHSHMSYLDAARGEFHFMETFMERALSAEPFDPIALLKNLTVAQMASVHSAPTEFGILSPLNPILGETCLYKTEKGSTMYLEQTSHHPPISNFHFIGPEATPYEIWGHVEYKVNVRGLFSAVTIGYPGKVTLRLPNGTEVQMQTVTAELTNLMSSKKTFTLTNQVVTVDKTNGYHAVTEFDVGKDQRNGYISSFFKSKKVEEDGRVAGRKDLTSIKIYKTTLLDGKPVDKKEKKKKEKKEKKKKDKKKKKGEAEQEEADTGNGEGEEQPEEDKEQEGEQVAEAEPEKDDYIERIDWKNSEVVVELSGSYLEKFVEVG